MTMQTLRPAQAKRNADCVTISIPRSALTIVDAPPTHISQRTSEATLGIPRRSFLRVAAEFVASGGIAARVGKLLVVDRLAFVAWLEARGRRQAEPPPRAANDADGDADDLAVELGLARAFAGGRG